MADQIDTTLRLIDRISKPLRNIANQTEHVINRMERLNRLTGSGQPKIAKEQTKITEEVKRTANATSDWGNRLTAVLGTYIGLQTVGGGIRIADEVTLTTARIDNMNDGLQTTAELQDSIYESAQRSRGSYLALQQAVGKLGILAEDAFGSSAEIVAFTELVQKSFTVGGASTIEQESALYQLTQALAAGKLQGDEFRSITENAPLIADAIAKFTGVSKGELKDLSSDGVITADIIRGAIFAAADDIETKFANIPKTFGAVFTEIKNFAVQTFQPVIATLNQALNSETGVIAINNIKTAIAQLAPIVSGIITNTLLLGDVFNAVYPYLPAIITTVALAAAGYLLITQRQNIADSISAVRKAILTGLTFAQTVATVGLTAAWRALNAAMKANVIIVIVGLVIALIAWIVNLAKTNDDFAKFFIRVWHGILNFFDQIPVFFLTLIDAMIEPFKLWAKTIGKLYDGVINGIIDGINLVLGLVNKITGSSFEIQSKFSFENLANNFDNFIGDKKSAAIARAEANKIRREGELDQFSANREAKRLAEANIDPASQTTEGLGGFGAGDGELGDIGKVKEVGKIKDTVDISSQDLKTLRELAEINSIQNFVTLQPSVSFGDTNIRQDGKSTEEIISNIAKVIDEQFNASARKVFA